MKIVLSILAAAFLFGTGVGAFALGQQESWEQFFPLCIPAVAAGLLIVATTFLMSFKRGLLDLAGVRDAWSLAAGYAGILILFWGLTLGAQREAMQSGEVNLGVVGITMNFFLFAMIAFPLGLAILADVISDARKEKNAVAVS